VLIRLKILRWLVRGLLALLLTQGVGIADAQDGGSQSIQGGVDVRVESFGVGNVARPGTWTGIRLALTDHGPSVRDVLVRLERPDADGDIESIQTAVALAPGATRGVWLYGRLPHDAGPGVLYDVIVEPLDESDDADRPVGRDPIGSARIGASGLFRSADSIIGVVGRRTLGLEAYAIEAQPGRGASGTMHNLTRTVTGLRPIDLPDAWMGLEQFDALVWASGEPASLLPSQVRAIEDWVRRGGRLIVVLDAASPDWTSSRLNPLVNITPQTTVQRLDGADLEALRPLLVLEDDRPMPAGETLHIFRPAPDARDTFSLLEDARGRTVAVRRLVGCGEVSLIGVDLGSSSLAGLLDAEAFWHRVLGRRGDLFTQSEMEELRQEGAMFSFFQQVWLDQMIAGRINKIGRAGVGVLLGLIVFGVYLLLAGPLSFALLGKLNLRRHSWVVFLAIAVLFTGIAWGGATVLRPAKEDITHLTLLEHVYLQPTQRAKVTFSALLPTYGAQTVSIPLEGPSELAALSSWEDPDALTRGSFPDSRPYRVDTRRPTSLRVPTRSTVKRFEALWAGGPRWRMIRPVDDHGVRIDERGRLQGTLTHDLPEALDRVTIVLVKRQTPFTNRRLGGPLLANAWAYRLTDPWAPGQAIDLRQLGDPSRAEQFFETLVSKEKSSTLGGVGAGAPPEDRLEMMLWRDALEPPTWRESNTGQVLDRHLQTRAAHGWGGGKWFTQPCLIVVGQIAEGPCPVPIEIDGETPPTSGRTALRWVYPLPSNPPGTAGAMASGDTN